MQLRLTRTRQRGTFIGSQKKAPTARNSLFALPPCESSTQQLKSTKPPPPPKELNPPSPYLYSQTYSSSTKLLYVPIRRSAPEREQWLRLYSKSLHSSLCCLLPMVVLHLCLYFRLSLHGGRIIFACVNFLAVVVVSVLAFFRAVFGRLICACVLFLSLSFVVFTCDRMFAVHIGG